MLTDTVVMISSRLEVIKAAQLAKTAELLRDTSAQLGDRGALLMPWVALRSNCHVWTP